MFSVYIKYVILPGLPPNRGSVQQLVSSEYIDEAGRIKVYKFLQVEGLTKIYAVGDCCNTQEDKMAAFAGKHGETVAANILKEVTGCGAPSPYKRPFVGMLVPFGAGEGVGVLNRRRRNSTATPRTSLVFQNS